MQQPREVKVEERSGGNWGQVVTALDDSDEVHGPQYIHNSRCERGMEHEPQPAIRGCSPEVASLRLTLLLAIFLIMLMHKPLEEEFKGKNRVSFTSTSNVQRVCGRNSAPIITRLGAIYTVKGQRRLPSRKVIDQQTGTNASGLHLGT